jgi:exodeoxyribonuclease V alpha subunit
MINSNLRAVFLDKRKVYFSGIGKNAVERMFSLFTAEELFSHIKNGNTDALRKSKITKRQILTLYGGYARFSPLLEVAIYLDNSGIYKPIATKVFEIWGHECMELIKKNPYRLLALASWENVDPIGLQRGPEFHLCRIVAALQNCMYLNYEDDKHTYIDENELFVKTRDLIGCSHDHFKEGFRLAITTGAIIAQYGHLQVPAVNLFERWFEKALSKIHPTGLSEPKVFRFIETSNYNILTHEQRQAVVNALTNRFSAYYGRGGRGKTFTLAAIADGAEKLLKKKVFLAAITSKAARKIERETGRKAFTVAKLLYRKEKSDLCHSLIVVDEASMLSLADAYHLIRRLPASANLLLVGDPFQIPSIDAGRVLFDIIRKNAVPNIELTINKRQDEKTDLQLNRILNGDFPYLDDYSPNAETGLFCIVTKSIEAAEDRAVSLYLELEALGEEVQIISPLHRYPGGSSSINEKVQMSKFGSKDYCKGTPVIWTKNQNTAWGTLLTNGSYGSVSCPGDSGYFLEIHFEHENEDVQLTWEEVDNYIELSYCLTVHKALGSEWQNVIIVLPRSNRMINRNMVYSALSRCKKRAIVIYDNHEFVVDKVRSLPSHELRRSLLFEKAL